MTSPLLSDSVLVDAATAVADAFGLGTETELATAWLVDEGDTVIVAELTGARPGRLSLAVNDEAAGQLLADPARLAVGLGQALGALVAGTGVQFALGTIDAAAAPSQPEPAHVVEIREQGVLAALFGVTLAAIAEHDEQLPPGSVAPESFAPEPFAEPGAAPAPSLLLPGLGPLALLQDIDMEITVELGRTTMPIRELLALQPGMVVEIDRVAGAPIDVLVNGHRFACGEVVVIDEEFGLRITEIVGAGS